MKNIIFGSLFFFVLLGGILALMPGCANQPTPLTIKADLEKVQADIATVAANLTPIIQSATVAADIAETATGNPELIPLTNAVSAAVQAANKAVAAQNAKP